MQIISGEYKGRKLLSPPPGSITRPITGAVKKSLFDTLGGRLTEAVVADLYCGTGTMGIEALSRGAGRCYFAERDRRVVQRLRRNIETIQAGDQCVIWQGDITIRLARWLGELPGKLDIAFVDPPYAHARRWSWDDVERSIFRPLAENLVADGVVVLRVPGDIELPVSEKLAGLVTLRQRRYGDMHVVLLGHPE